LSLVIGIIVFQILTGNPLGVLTWRSSQYLLYGFIFAIGASLVSGIYPAWKAPNDPPVESLRS
jgi:putative ABC transport system permease protein